MERKGARPSADLLLAAEAPHIRGTHPHIHTYIHTYIILSYLQYIHLMMSYVQNISSTISNTIYLPMYVCIYIYTYIHTYIHICKLLSVDNFLSGCEGRPPEDADWQAYLLLRRRVAQQRCEDKKYRLHTYIHTYIHTYTTSQVDLHIHTFIHGYLSTHTS